MEQESLFDIEETGTAIFSPCGKYRYRLTRELAEPEPPFSNCLKVANFIMLNPSTADAEIDDPTIRRCIGFAREWGMHRLIVTNLFAFRATDPKELYKTDDPVGPENLREIKYAANEALFGITVCAWGTHGAFMRHGEHVMKMLASNAAAEDHMPHHLGLTKEGYPKHPLYLKKSIKPERWV